LAQDLRHRFSLGEFIDELVQVADLSHERLGDDFDANPTDHARDFGPRGVGRGSLSEEGLEVRSLGQMCVELTLTIAGQPEDDLIDLSLGATLLLRLAR